MGPDQVFFCSVKWDLKQKRFLILSDARQPEVRRFPFKYAMTLTNCIARCLLRIKIFIETICPKFWGQSLPENAKKPNTFGQRALLRNVFA